MDAKNRVSDNDTSKQQCITPVKDGRFQFSCHKGVPCFTDCCRDLRLILTPYDIIRLKNRLGLSSKEFLDTHTVSEFDTAMGLPTVLLKMKEDSRRSCFFVSAEGCTIYEDRPGACRVYPLGRAAQKGVGAEGVREKYFVVKEPHCRGFEEKKTWNIHEWLSDQEVDTYNEMNDYWTEVTTSQHPDRYKGLDGKKIQMFFMASYNLDSFKKFVFSSKFLDLFEIDRKTQEEIRSDEVALLKFGCRWLKFSLFGEATIQVKAAVIQAKKEETGMRQKK